jgi:hypothetical protein
MKSIDLHILDIAQNSIRAGASEIRISVNDSYSNDLVSIRIEDDGSGIPDEWQHRVTDPFFTTRTTRRTGFGLPLLKFHAELTGGQLKICKSKSGGAVIEAVFVRSNIDRQPLGDLAGVLTILAAGTEGPEIEYTHTTDKGSYRFSSRETKDYLATDTLSENGIRESIKEMLGHNILELYEIKAEYRNVI